MRAPGFFRREKGKNQHLISVGDRITPDALLEGMERCFKALNFPFYDEESFSEERWSELKEILASKVLNRLEKEIEIKKILSLGEDNLPANIRKKEVQERAANHKTKTTTGLNYIGEGSLLDAVKYGGDSGRGSLLDAVNTWKSQGGRDLFNWPGHNWDGSDKRGCCPWHESNSGTAGWLSDIEDGTFLYHCPTCTDNKGIDALTYHYWLLHGLNTELKGREWAQFAKEMTGFVDVPEAKEGWKERYERERREKAIYWFTRKPDVVVETGYLPSIARLELPKGIIALKGDWGVGKTYFISNFLKEYDGKVLQVAHLNALLDNTAPKFGLAHHKDIKASGDYDALNNPFSSPKLAITIDSLGNQLKPAEWVWNNKFILILDELEQALKYACKSPNLSKNRQKVREKLEWLIKNAEYLVLSDRDLSDEALTYIEKVRADSKPAYIIQHTGEKGLGRKIGINTNKKKDVVLTRSLEDIKNKKKIAIPFENKSDLLAYEDMLRAAGIPDSAWFSAHGDNSNEKEIRQIIKNIDKEYTNYQVLLYTMTLGTAISLETKHFDKIYGFFTGDAFDAWCQTQMLFRYRLECEIEIWVSPKKRTLEIKEENLMKDLVASVDGTETLQANFSKIEELREIALFPTVSGKIGEEDLPWIKLRNAYTARTNASMANPSQTLCDVLESAGFELGIEQSIEQSDEATRTVEGDEHKAIKKENRDKDDLSVASAELLTDTALAEKLKQSGSLTKKERNQITKTLLHKETGLEVDQELVKKDRTKNFVSSVKMLMMVMSCEEDAVAADLIDAENKMHSDRKFYQVRRKLFIELGAVDLVNFLVGGGAYTSKGVKCEIVESVARNIRKDKRKIKRLLGYTVNTEMITKNAQGDDLPVDLHEYKVSDANLVNELLSNLGIKLATKQNRNTLYGVLRIYSLDQKNWEEITKVINHQKTLKSTPKWDVFLEQKKAHFLEAETQSQQGLNPVTPPTSFSYIKYQGGVTANQASESKESLSPTDRTVTRIGITEPQGENREQSSRYYGPPIPF